MNLLLAMSKLPPLHESTAIERHGMEQEQDLLRRPVRSEAFELRTRFCTVVHDCPCCDYVDEAAL